MKFGLIVEGHHDANHIRNVFGYKYEYVVTNGTRFTNRTRMDIERMMRFVDKVYILTDPDEAGDLIAQNISEAYPTLERITLDPEYCKYLDRRYQQWCGVEYALPHHLKDVFKKVGIA